MRAVSHEQAHNILLGSRYAYIGSMLDTLAIPRKESGEPDCDNADFVYYLSSEASEGHVEVRFPASGTMEEFVALLKRTEDSMDASRSVGHLESMLL